MNIKFRRQHPIDPCIVDFCAPRLKLIIDVDDGKHLDQTEYDQYRTDYLESKGYQVVRLWNNDVLHEIAIVIQGIEEVVERKNETNDMDLAL